MSIHVKDGGEWKTVVRPYVKRNGVWAPVKFTYAKHNGVWKEAFEWDVAPPPPPILALTVQETRKGGQYILVGARIPGTAHNTDLARIRVLVGKSGSSGAYPATWQDATYIGGATDGFPKEPWSERYYNGYKVGGADHNDSSEFVHKGYPRNAGPNSNHDLAPTLYRFAAWAQDLDGNWSTGTRGVITVPKRGDPTHVVKSGRFQPTHTGTYRGSNDSWTPGDLIQSSSPGRRGAYLYSNTIREALGQGNKKVSVRRAQIQIRRREDSGSAQACIYLGWTRDRWPSEFSGDQNSPAAHGRPVLIGKISKGQTKWFDIPEAFWPNLANNIGGLILWNKDPNKASAVAADYSELVGRNEDTGTVRPGEVYIVWQEG